MNPESSERHWDEKFERLREYKNKHGNCLVPPFYPQDVPLGRWLDQQRTFAKQGNLRQDRIERLEELGVEVMIWTASPAVTTTTTTTKNNTTPLRGVKPRPNNRWEKNWMEKFKKLLIFKKKHGHFRVTKKYDYDQQLARWVARQREVYKSGKILEHHKTKLDSIGFTWSGFVDIWDEYFEKLQAYKKLHGDCHVPHSYKEEPPFGAWVATQRKMYMQGSIDKTKKAKLDSIGFEWCTKRTLYWDTMFEKLAEYMKKNGNCQVPDTYEGTSQLNRWAKLQRDLYSRGELKDDRRVRLDSIGFDWTAKSALLAKWEECFQQLTVFKREHGHCLVPKDHPLTGWVKHQRNRRNHPHKRRPLSLEEFERLDSIGFVWKTRNNEHVWDENFERLKKFKNEHGHCLVNKSKHDKSFGQWVDSLRHSHKMGTLRKDRREKLDSIGFVGSGLDERWDGMYERLLAFREENGHCLVPHDYEDSGRFARWVTTQRHAYRKGTIRPDRKALLNDIGFAWSSSLRDSAYSRRREHEWEAMLARLVQFKRKYGHCRVPKRYKRDQQLGNWIITQRALHSSGKLYPQRKAKLEEVGFLWRIPSADRWSLSHKFLTPLNMDASREESENEDDDTCEQRSRDHSPSIAPHGERREELSRPCKRKRICYNEDVDEPVEEIEQIEPIPLASSSSLFSVQQHSSSAVATPLVGQRIAVYWQGDDEYYPGIISQKGEDGRVCIGYDDGAEEWIFLREETYLLLDDESSTIWRPDNPPQTDLCVGSRVSVWWSSEDEYFDGTVRMIDAKSKSCRKPHFIEYDDGDTEWVNLAFRRYRLAVASSITTSQSSLEEGEPEFITSGVRPVESNTASPSSLGEDEPEFVPSAAV